jgi:Flp pilus assembly protein TadG
MKEMGEMRVMNFGAGDGSVQTGSGERLVGRRLRGRRQKGSSLIEFALVMTFLLVPTTVGIAEFATYLGNYLALTDAVAAGARALAVSRQETLNPCSLVYTAVTTAYQAAAIESGTNPPALTFTVTLNPASGAVTEGPWVGTNYPGGCSSGSTTTGVPADLTQGSFVTVKATYSPLLIFNAFNITIPIAAQTTEVVQ